MAAQWQATVLSFEMGSLGKSSSPEGVTMLRGAACGRRVSFADEAVILIYSEFGAWRPIPIDLTELSLWKAKPWTLNCAPATSSLSQATGVDRLSSLLRSSAGFDDDTQECTCLQLRSGLTLRRHDAHPLRPPRQVRYEFDLPGFPQEGRPFIDTMFPWVQQIWQGVFAAQADTEYLDEGPVLYLLTWYLHPQDHALCEKPRVAKLDLYFEHWEDDIRRLWQDTVRSDLPLDVHLVYPEPPRSTGAMHSGHLLVVQGQQPPTKAALISTFLRTVRDNELTQIATFTPPWVTDLDVRRLSQARPQLLNAGTDCWIDDICCSGSGCCP